MGAPFTHMTQEQGAQALYFVVQGLFERADSIGQDLANQFRALSSAGVRCRVFAGLHRSGLYPDLPVERSDDLAGVLRASPAPVLYHWCDGWRGMDDLLSVASVPVILRWHNNTPPWFFAPYSLESTARTLRGFSSILEVARAPHVSLMTNSSFSARQLGVLGVPAAKVSIVHPLSDYLSDPSAYRGTRKVSVGKLRLLFAGRVVPHKGQKHVIRAAHAFQSAYGQRCRVVFSGRADSAMSGYVREFESLAAELGVEATWPGEVTPEELEALYENSDVFICLSEHEGFGLPVIEAMKAGLPVIGYRCSAVAETLRDHPLACDRLDQEEIAARLFCLTDPAVSDAVVRFQDQVVLPRFLPTKTHNQLFASLNGIVAGLRPEPEDEVVTVPGDSASSVALALERHLKHLRPSERRTADAAEAEPPERHVTLHDIRAYRALLNVANKVADTGNLRDDWMGTSFRSPIPLIGRLVDRYKRFVLYSQDGLVVGQTKLHASTLARLDEIEAKLDRLSRRWV